jgi:hypothetical protein
MFRSMNGSLGKIVFYRRRGVQCARTYVIPRNPDTPQQRINREAFAAAVAAWRLFEVRDRNRYNRKARGRGMSGYNLFISEYMRKQIRHGNTMPGHAPLVPGPSAGVPLRLHRGIHGLMPACIEPQESPALERVFSG